MPGALTEKWNGLPPMAKNAIVVGGVVVGGILIFQIISIIKKDAASKKDLAESNIATAELADLAGQGVFPTLTEGQIQEIITSLIDAMDGCGTNEQRVYDAFNKLQNIADLKLLQKNFGVQNYQPCAASQPISFVRWQFDNTAFGGGLSVWINYDLGTGEIATLNTILSSKGINFKF